MLKPASNSIWKKFSQEEMEVFIIFLKSVKLLRKKSVSPKLDRVKKTNL